MMRTAQIHTVVVMALAALLVACSGGADPEPTPEQAENGFTRAASAFVDAVRDRDAEAYSLLITPENQPSADRMLEIMDSADLAGCHGSDAEFRATEGVGVVYVDVIFNEPCGEFGVTDECNLGYRRSRGDWRIFQWVCSTTLPEMTPTVIS